MNTPGIVHLVGAGPGDPGLITVRGRDCLRAADVVLYDRLIPIELLAETRPGAERIHVGKAPDRPSVDQAEINRRLIEHARRGSRVVRLKGGDPLVFGRGGEELDACRAAGIECVVVPGVTSAVAVPASAGIPLTQRGRARSFAVIAGRVEEARTAPDHDYEALARMDTLVILMGHARLRAVADALIAAGRDPDTPAATIASGTTPRARWTRATLGTIADAADREDLRPPVVTVIGETAALADPDAGAAGRRGEARPLAGRRVAVTRAVSTSGEMHRQLIAAGARVIPCPLIRITYPPAPPPDFERAVERLPETDWLAFTSIHAARGFWHGLRARGRDARALGPCRLAAIGPATARELARHGLVADLVPPVATAEHLLAALREAGRLRPAPPGPWTRVRPAETSGGRRAMRVFCPHGNLALPTLADGLRAAGADVVESVVYLTEETTPDPAVLDELRSGVDALLFCSPSAVRRFARLRLEAPGGAIGCIGPTTAAAARESGYPVDVVPENPGAAGLVASLAEHFRAAGAAT